MLKITTSNGDTLIHADQQPDSYNGRSADGSTYMVHGRSWGKHKYIRKEGNRYIYPEDLKKKAEDVGNAISSTASNVKKSVKDNLYKTAESAAQKAFKFAEEQSTKYMESSPIYQKQKAKYDNAVDQAKKSAKINDIKTKNSMAAMTRESIKDQKEHDRKIKAMEAKSRKREALRKKEEEEEKKLKKEKDRKKYLNNVRLNKKTKDVQKHIDEVNDEIAKERKKINQQRDNAHRMTTHKKTSSKNSVELQKQKTAQRKQAKDTLERTSDTLERMRKKNNRRNSK